MTTTDAIFEYVMHCTLSPLPFKDYLLSSRRPSDYPSNVCDSTRDHRLWSEATYLSKLSRSFALSFWGDDLTTPRADLVKSLRTTSAIPSVPEGIQRHPENKGRNPGSPRRGYGARLTRKDSQCLP